MKQLLLLLFVLFFSRTLFAQDFAYDSYYMSDILMKSYEKDKTAHAVVLKEFGKTWIGSEDGLPLYHEYHVKIKIFDSKAFDEGNISIPIYKSDNNSFEQVLDVAGVTYYTDERGSIQRTYLDSKTVVTENRNKYWSYVKFAMPNLRNGCVIEYKYTLRSPYSLNFKDWTFQSNIPKMYSEYEARIPGIFNFKALLRGDHKLDKNVAEIQRECFSAGGTKCDCSKITYAMNDVPAFVEEDYMTAPKNFMSAINFELNDYVDPYTGLKTVKTQTWDDIDRSLKQHEEFGAQIKKSGLFKDKIAIMTGGATDQLAKATAIYHYLQSNLKHNRFIGIYSDNGLRKTLETHSGSVADINLGLVTALRAANIDAEAVLLSTREHGFVSKLYPATGDFNYVVAKANIGDKTYLLDATDPLLPFGLLPEECINDQGRVMSMNKPSYWIDMVAAQKRTRTHIMNLTLQSNGKLTGKLNYYSNGYEALDKRRSIKKFNSVDEYVENLDEKMPKVKILKYEVKNVDSLENSLVESYDVEIDVYDKMDANRLAFNPYMLHRITDNPFKLSERTYPVDMGASTDMRTVLTVTLPEQFIIETTPEIKAVGLPNQGGKFVTGYEPLANGFTFSHIIQLNKPIYSSEEYPYLKEFYNAVVKAEKADIIFKKK
jgi:hypothetical protein